MRRYRYLLRAAPPQVLEKLHARALSVLDPGVRANLLRTAQERSRAPADLTIEDTDILARVITEAEQRRPGLLVTGYNEMALGRLAHLVLADPTSAPFLTGYDSWDGSDRPLLPPGEDVVVRQYRYLLRTAPLDALEAAHREALSKVDPGDRAVVLRTVQTQLVTGAHLGVEDVEPLARLVCLGERRDPGALTEAMPPAPLKVLAQAVIDSEAAFGLFGGYAAWDGRNPPRPQEHDDSAYGEDWHTGLQSRGRDGT